MVYRVDRGALAAFIARQVEVIESTPTPADIASIGGDLSPGGLTADELRAVWLGAGLAAQVGLALVDEPERFITSTPPVALVAVGV